MTQLQARNFSTHLIPRLTEKEFIQGELFSRKRLIAFVISFLQFVALFIIIAHFNIERSSGISQVAPIIFSAFITNSFIPLRFRPALLFSLSIFLIYFAFGVFSGTVLIAIGLAMIISCHLPLPFIIRVLSVFIIATGVFILRSDLFYAPRGSLIAPFVASMFMFRMIIYHIFI
jgi:hypothetical protein